MDGFEEREQLLAQLAGYLEELRETGVEDLFFGPEDPAVPSDEAPRAEAHPPHGAAGPGPATPAAPPVGREPGAALTDAGDAPAAAAVQSPAAPAPPASPSTRPPRHSGRPFKAYGNPKARLVMVLYGEGFQGESGELLRNIVKAMGLTREEICLMTFVSVPPSGEPLRSALLEAIAAVGPKAVVALGETASQLLLDSSLPIAELRGRFHDLNGASLMPTLHPDDMLADPALKRPVWGDMQQVMRFLKEEP